MKTAGIYKITCIANGHFYIGRTIDFDKRMQQHKTDLRSGKHKNQRMQNCFDKYGESSFRYELIKETAPDLNTMIQEEQSLIDKSINLENCMNINSTAKCACYVPMTEERKRKIAEKRIGKKGTPKTDAQRKHMSEIMMGHSISEETRQKIRESRIGQKLSDGTIQKLKQRFSGKGNPMYGRTGDRSPQSKSVLQIDPETGNVLNRFQSQTEAASHFGSKDGSNLGKAIRKGIKAYGFLWRYEIIGQSTIESTDNSVNE